MKNILKVCKIDPVNYMDLAHDHILTDKSMKSLKYYYKTGEWGRSIIR